MTKKDGTAFKGVCLSLDGTKVTAITDANGHYSFSSIKPGSYTVRAIAANYVPAAKEGVSVEMALADITSPADSVAIEVSGSVANVSWTEPDCELRYDATNANLVSVTGYAGWGNSLIGTAFTNNSTLKEVAWFTTDYHVDHKAINLMVLALDENGLPTQNLLAKVEQAPTTDYPVVKGHYYCCDDVTATNQYGTMEGRFADSFNGNLMIRAYVDDQGEIDYNDYGMSDADNILVLCLLILHFVSSCFVSTVFFRLLTFHHHLARHL